MILHTKYQGSTPSGIIQEDFLWFDILGCVKHVTPELGPILTKWAYFEVY